MNPGDGRGREARPHPGPLPRGEGESFAVFLKNTRLDRPNSRSQSRSCEDGNPLLGERIQVRASVKTNFNPRNGDYPTTLTRPAATRSRSRRRGNGPMNPGDGDRARPHPGPLPRGEGEIVSASSKIWRSRFMGAMRESLGEFSPRPSPPRRGRSGFRVAILRLRWICLGSGVQCANPSGKSLPQQRRIVRRLFEKHAPGSAE
jgi:hypothetical protein